MPSRGHTHAIFITNFPLSSLRIWRSPPTNFGHLRGRFVSCQSQSEPTPNLSAKSAYSVAQPRSRDICTSTSHTWLDFRGFSGGIVGDRQTDRFRLGVIQTNGETNSITTVESVISLPAQNQARVGEQPGYSSLSKPVFVMQIASWSC